MPHSTYKIENVAFSLAVSHLPDGIFFRLMDIESGFAIADGQGVYRAICPNAEGIIVAEKLTDITTDIEDDRLILSGLLAGLSVRQTLRLPTGRALLEEMIELSNPNNHAIELKSFEAGFCRMVADPMGNVIPDVHSDRWEAVPLRHEPTDPLDFDVAFNITDLIKSPGREQRANHWPPPEWPQFGHYPSTQWKSEGWSWTHGSRNFGIFKYNQDFMELCRLSLQACSTGIYLLFGGASLEPQIPLPLMRIEPGQRVQLGETRYVSLPGGYEQVSYAFRCFLDEKGCRFPVDYDPPVHWNELYDNPEWTLGTPGVPPVPRLTRPFAYTKVLIEEEAKKAREYGCQALYLDPGWDTDFGTFLWGEDWLGPRKRFVHKMQSRYGLRVSLHCPLATWMSLDGRGVSGWPEAAFVTGPDGKRVDGFVCLGSKQYLDEAANRLLAHCRDGVKFLMFDGNWWPGGCWNPDHGHPVPYTMEDHVRANLELARRIHSEYPDVLIEMHDMIAGGSIQRYTPVYYKYGLPGSYDENWGFELMWRPMEDIITGRARSLYYYNLGCNVPIYLHVDLRDDNEHCLVLWWYASTCRHLGIGGTHRNRAIADAQKKAMAVYGELQQFYKRGDFYGLDEEIHIHVLPKQEAFVANLFNLSDEIREIAGTISFKQMGLPVDRWYNTPKGASYNRDTGSFTISLSMRPWSAETVHVKSLAPY